MLLALFNKILKTWTFYSLKFKWYLDQTNEVKYFKWAKTMHDKIQWNVKMNHLCNSNIKMGTPNWRKILGQKKLILSRWRKVGVQATHQAQPKIPQVACKKKEVDGQMDGAVYWRE
jgi:hypothetical protein